MARVNTRGMGVMLMLAALAAIFLATAAHAQTPAEDQYGSPTGDPPGESAPGGDDPASTEASVKASSGEEGDVLGGVLPATGGAPIYLALAGAILLGTGATLWLRFRHEQRT
jgi:LPXTG-motif cell wall-anchored protein